MSKVTVFVLALAHKDRVYTVPFVRVFQLVLKKSIEPAAALVTLNGIELLIFV
jgi:hypothetical protein